MAYLIPPLGEVDKHTVVVHFLQNESDTETKEVGRGKGSSFRLQCVTSGLIFHGMEIPTAVNEDHCSPSAVVR